MKIVTLGYCCKKSKANHENAVIAAKNKGIQEEVKNIADTSEIVKLGVMFTPAIMIDGKIVSSGRMLSVEQIEKLIEKHI